MEQRSSRESPVIITWRKKTLNSENLRKDSKTPKKSIKVEKSSAQPEQIMQRKFMENFCCLKTKKF